MFPKDILKFKAKQKDCSSLVWSNPGKSILTGVKVVRWFCLQNSTKLLPPNNEGCESLWVITQTLYHTSCSWYDRTCGRKCFLLPATSVQLCINSVHCETDQCLNGAWCRTRVILVLKQEETDNVKTTRICTGHQSWQVLEVINHGGATLATVKHLVICTSLDLITVHLSTNLCDLKKLPVT